MRLLFIVGCLTFAVWVFAPSSTPTAPPPPAKATIDKSPALQASRQKLIEQMINQQALFTKVERNGKTMPRAWVTPKFMLLDFESKQKFLGVIYAFYLDGSEPLASVALINALNGEEVGRFSAAGLDID